MKSLTFSPRIHLALHLLLLSFFVYPLVTAFSLDPLFYIRSSDSFFYLNIADNLRHGRGLVTSFNAYQFWPGSTYPALPYVHVGFSVLLSLWRVLFSSFASLCVLNAFIAWAGSRLVLGLARRVYQDEGIAWAAALLTAAHVSTQVLVLKIHTEPLSLLLVLAAFRVILSERMAWRRRYFWGGLLAVAGVFVRSASLIYVAAGALAILCDAGQDQPRFKRLGFFILGPALVMVLYAALLFGVFGTLTVQYPHAFKNYYLAMHTDASYFIRGLPVLRMAKLPAMNSCIFLNFSEMAYVLFCILRIFGIFAVLRCLRLWRQRRLGEQLFFWGAILPVVGALVFYPYMRLGEYHWSRFLLAPVAFLFLLGLAESVDFCRRFMVRTGRLFFLVATLVVLTVNIYQSWGALKYYWDQAAIRSGIAGLLPVRAWVRRHVAPGELCAVSSDVMNDVYLERPVVSLPLHKTLNMNKLRDFCMIYQPGVIVLEGADEIHPWLMALGYKPVLMGYYSVWKGEKYRLDKGRDA